MRTRLVESSLVRPAIVFARVLHLIPKPLPAHAVALAVNHSLRGQPFAERLGELSGRCFRLHVNDLSAALTFEITRAGLRPSSTDPHVTIRGALADFVALALRREDPDTLFFQRRLVVEGETETGLHLKNLLDGWEYDLSGHVSATLPPLLAQLTFGVVGAVLALRGLSRLRHPGSHRSNRPADRPMGA